MGETDYGGNCLALMGRAMLSKALIQFSVDGWWGVCCFPSLLFGLRPNYGRSNGDFLQKDLCQHAAAPRTVVVSPRTPWQATLDPQICWRPMDNHRQVWLSVLWCLLGSEHTRFFCAFKESVSPVLWNFCNKIPLAFKVKFPMGFSPFAGWEICSVAK